MNKNLVIILLLILGCISAFKAFRSEDSKQKKLYAFIAIFIGGVLFVLGNLFPK
jgi:hypothetical protein